MAELVGEQAGESVEVAVALVVPDVGTLAADDDGYVAGAVVVVGVARERHPQMVAGLVSHEVAAGLGDGLRSAGHRVPHV